MSKNWEKSTEKSNWQYQSTKFVISFLKMGDYNYSLLKQL